MRLLYLDASAWVKFYLQEDGSRAIERLFVSRQPLVACTFGYVEVAATISRRGRGEGHPSEAIDQLLQALHHDWRSSIYRLRMEDELFTDAAELAIKFGLRGADAVHLSAALSLMGSLEQDGARVVMTAADQQLLKAAASAGLDTLLPTDM